MIRKFGRSTWRGRYFASRGVRRLWCGCESHDDKGNVIVYEYQGEYDYDIDLSQSNERNRVRTANRYVRRVKYGNHNPFLPDLNNPASLNLPDEWHFEVFFDYHEQEDVNALLASVTPSWQRRADPFSTWRPRLVVPPRPSWQIGRGLCERS
jgi:hypothetical protein